MSELTLDTAIKHCLEVAEQNTQGLYDAIALGGQNPTQEEIARCEECAADHRQLAEWLTELKELRNSVGAVKLSSMKEALELIREYKVENIAQKKLITEYKRLLKAAIKDIGDMSRYCLGMCCDSCPQIHTLSRGYQSCIWRHEDEALKLIGGSENE